MRRSESHAENHQGNSRRNGSITTFPPTSSGCFLVAFLSDGETLSSIGAISGFILRIYPNIRISFLYFFLNKGGGPPPPPDAAWMETQMRGGNHRWQVNRSGVKGNRHTGITTRKRASLSRQPCRNDGMRMAGAHVFFVEIIELTLGAICIMAAIIIKVNMIISGHNMRTTSIPIALGFLHQRPWSFFTRGVLVA